jgi:outer membrane protein TolC
MIPEADDTSDGFIVPYQSALVKEGPIHRQGTEGLDILTPSDDPSLPRLNTVVDPNTGRHTVNLSIPEALTLALSNNPQIRVVSFDPSIAKYDMTKALSEFDPTIFGEYSYDKEDNPTDSVYLVGQQSSRLWEMGIKQKNTVGTEFSASYAIARNSDDLVTRNLNTRYEPVMLFQIRQPLLRGGWEQFNKAGINIAALNYKIATVSFREATEEMASRLISSYWSLQQAREDLAVQEKLLEETVKTLERLELRQEIDTTATQVSQVVTFLEERKADYLSKEQRLYDTQDELVQLLSDSQVNLIDSLEVIPTTPPNLDRVEFQEKTLLLEAMKNNPRIQQAKLEIDIAEINLKAAETQRLPRLDLIASSALEGLDKTYGSSSEQIEGFDYTSWTVGVYLEYPLGNRGRNAELGQRRLEISKARTLLYNTSDTVTQEVKRRLRQLEKAQENMEIQRKGVDAARIYLQGLQDAEQVQPKLSFEFLFVKLQSQGLLARAKQQELNAIGELNRAFVQLARATGTVLDISYIQKGIREVADSEK